MAELNDGEQKEWQRPYGSLVDPDAHLQKLFQINERIGMESEIVIDREVAAADIFGKGKACGSQASFIVNQAEIDKARCLFPCVLRLIGSVAFNEVSGAQEIVAGGLNSFLAAQVAPDQTGMRQNSSSSISCLSTASLKLRILKLVVPIAQQ